MATAPPGELCHRIPSPGACLKSLPPSFEIFSQLQSGSVATFRIFLETFQTDCLQILIHVLVECPWGHWVLFRGPQLLNGFLKRVPAVGGMSGQHSIEDSSQAIDVA